ncbi:MAG TPA: beta-propeller fold lactonase family protein [Terracidiphilus sp.]|nr:beta-propeller fold lactonase family protein [Terracidiphilus sp.]
MKLTKFGKALAMGALSAAVVFGVTSCVQSYTVGYLYVTGTETVSSGNNGIVSGFKIDHNTGRLTPINTLPVASGGANPVRAVLTLGSRFLYVLNRGVTASGSPNCYGTGANACVGSNIEQFTVGGNGVLTPQETFQTSGINPFRMLADGSGNYLLVLDHDAPDNANPSSTDNCALALGPKVTTCADITVFKIDQNTGRLSLVVNAQVTAAGNNQPIAYFPVPANPVDFVLSSSALLTLTGAPSPTSYPYTGGTVVFPYNYSGTSGQLTLSQNSVQQIGDSGINATAIVSAGGAIYVLNNEPLSVNFNDVPTTATSQLLPFSVGTGGALQAESGGAIPDAPTLTNPIYMILENKGQFLYVANQGNNIQGPNPQSGIAAYHITTAPAYQLSFQGDEPFGSGSGPQCIVEDPSNQFIYTADAYDSTVTGRVINPETGDLTNLVVTNDYKLLGPASWCVVDGRTS